MIYKLIWAPTFRNIPLLKYLHFVTIRQLQGDPPPKKKKNRTHKLFNYSYKNKAKLFQFCTLELLSVYGYNPRESRMLCTKVIFSSEYVPNDLLGVRDRLASVAQNCQSLARPPLWVFL